MNKDKKSVQEESKYLALLSYIENNVSKEDFVSWLNSQQDLAFSEEDTWEHLKAEVSGEEGVPLGELKTYAKSLSEEQDIEHLLESVKQTTQEAEKTAERLNYLNSFRKFTVAVGGATLFSGALLLTMGGLLLFDILALPLNESLHHITINITLFIGTLNILAGLLLTTR